MQFGRSYEEFEVGAIYRHWPGKTITEADDHLFCLITMNHHPLHLDAHYAETSTQFGKNVVVGNLVYSVLLGPVGGRRIRKGHSEPGDRVAATRRADISRRHHLRRNPGAGQVGVQVEGRSGRGLRRNHRLQAGRHRGVHLPPQGHGAQAELPARRVAASSPAGRRQPDRAGTTSRTCGRPDRIGCSRQQIPVGQGVQQAGDQREPRQFLPADPAQLAGIVAGPRAAAGRRCRGSPRRRTGRRPGPAGRRCPRCVPPRPAARSPRSIRERRPPAGPRPAGTCHPGTDHSPAPGGAQPADQQQPAGIVEDDGAGRRNVHPVSIASAGGASDLRRADDRHPAGTASAEPEIDGLPESGHRVRVGSSWCPRCGAELIGPSAYDSDWRCARHGRTLPLTVFEQLDDATMSHIRDRAEVPLWLPDPMPAGWLLSGLAAVGDSRSRLRATAVACRGPAPLGGEGEWLIVAEEPGIGLGAALAQDRGGRTAHGGQPGGRDSGARPSDAAVAGVRQRGRTEASTPARRPGCGSG